jgi:hypothetical protein
MEDLYSWVISMNFLRVNANYDLLTRHFGKIAFPLYRTYKKKPKKLFFNLDEKQSLHNANKDQSNKEVKNSVTVLKKRMSIQQEKMLELPDLKKKVVDLFCKVFICILGDIQYRLDRYSDDGDEDSVKRGIKVPPHLKSCENLNHETNNYNYKYYYNSENEEEESEIENGIENGNENGSKAKEQEDKENEKNMANSIDNNDNNDNVNNNIILGSESSKENVLRGKKKEKEEESNSCKIESNRQSSEKVINEIKNSKEETSFKFENGSTKNKNTTTNNKNTKRDIFSSSENTSIGGKSKNKDGANKFRKSDYTKITDGTKSQNQIKTQTQLENNEGSHGGFQDFEESNFDMDEDDEDNVQTHIPRYFTKDKTIVQLKEYPELINDFDNNDMRFDSNNTE